MGANSSSNPNMHRNNSMYNSTFDLEEDLDQAHGIHTGASQPVGHNNPMYYLYNEIPGLTLRRRQSFPSYDYVEWRRATLHRDLI
jgi:hypothetical protein